MRAKVVVRKFECDDPDDDCPSIGFEVIRATNAPCKPKQMLVASDLKRLRAGKVKVVVK